MTILKLLKGLHIDWKRGPLDGAIKGVAYDSRLVKKDYLFVAVKGFSVDGHDYIKDAVNRGATMIVAEHPVEITDSRQSDSKKEATCISVPDSREALALISAAFYGHPSKRLSLIGITGTNGKTTTSFITKSIIDAGAGKAGLLGKLTGKLFIFVIFTKAMILYFYVKVLWPHNGAVFLPYVQVVLPFESCNCRGYRRWSCQAE